MTEVPQRISKPHLHEDSLCTFFPLQMKFERASDYNVRVHANPSTLRQFKLRSGNIRRLPSSIGRHTSIFDTGADEKQGNCSSDDTDASDEIQVPLFPKRANPKVLFGEALLALCGFWLSDYGFMTRKHSERVAGIIWFVGTFGGGYCGAAFFLSFLTWLGC
jgi:hypothetical protein